VKTLVSAPHDAARALPLGPGGSLVYFAGSRLLDDSEAEEIAAWLESEGLAKHYRIEALPDQRAAAKPAKVHRTPVDVCRDVLGRADRYRMDDLVATFRLNGVAVPDDLADAYTRAELVAGLGAILDALE